MAADALEALLEARDLTAGDLAKITDPYTRASLQLQAAFGLRRRVLRPSRWLGESLKRKAS